MTNIPTISQLYSGIISDLEAEFNITIPVFGRIFLRVVASVQAAKLKLYYLVIGSVQKNIFVDTADSEASGGTLERFGRVKLNRNPYPASSGEYVVIVTGTVGATIPSQTTFKSDDSSTSPGFLFVLDNAFTLTSTTDYITIRALTSGTISQLFTADTLTATAPIANVNSSISVNSVTIIPVDAETLEEYRAKAIAAYRSEPQGGAATDFRLWASNALGVVQTYPYAKSGESAVVDLYVEGNTSNGVPSGGVLTNVESMIELDPDITKPLNERGRRPLGVFQVNYLPINPLDVDIVINNFTGTPQQETNIINAITDALKYVRPYVSGADILADRNDVVSITRLSFIVLSAEPSVSFSSIDLSVNSTPVSTFQFLLGNIPFINSVTFA